MDLGTVFEELALRREADVHLLDAAAHRQLATFGVRVHAGRATLDAAVELLAARRIREHLGAGTNAWLGDLGVRAHIDSTNSELVRRALTASVDGTVLMAEVQTAGRGRRGRDWRSPFARNLALSIGIRIDRSLKEIGAVSLAAGVAVANALEAAGVGGIALKWPNDVLLAGRKLCGILIELPRAAEPPEIVIGIGVNVGGGATVAALVDQEVADVTEEVPGMSRNVLAGRMIDAVFEICRRFERDGFEAIKPQYDALHRFQGKPVRIVAGQESVTGVVAGVAFDGALRLDTPSGMREFNGGEVSLRG